MTWLRAARRKANNGFRRVGRLAQKPPADLLLAAKAYVILGRSRYVIKTKGLKAIEPTLGTRLAESPNTVPAEHAARAETVAWAVLGAKSYTPWLSNCFPQALAAHRLLKADGIDCTVYFGAVLRASDEAQARGVAAAGEFAAHAWVRVGDAYIVGGETRELYEPMVWFAP